MKCSGFFVFIYCALEKMVSRGAHNPEVAGSRPARATTKMHSGVVWRWTQPGLITQIEEKSSNGDSIAPPASTLPCPSG